MRGKDLSPEDNKLDYKLRKRQHKVLDGIIFPAMANLTYFLECIADYPEFQEIFEDDLKDLFGIRNNSGTKHVGFMFKRLVKSALLWDFERKRK